MKIRIRPLSLLACLTLAGCGTGGVDTGSTRIANGGIVVTGQNVALHGLNGAEASIDASGSLFIGDRTVAVDAAQRNQLQQYYEAAQAVREQGIATGEAGVSSAAVAIKNAALRILDVGNQADRQDAIAAQRVREAANMICLDLRQIKAAQDQLGATLPAFKPYAGIIDDSGADCAASS